MPAEHDTRVLVLPLVWFALTGLGCSSQTTQSDGPTKEEPTYQKVEGEEEEEGWDFVIESEVQPIAPGNKALNVLAARLRASAAPVETPCIEPGTKECVRGALDQFFVSVDNLVASQERSVRILQLGDSHIAADYITKTARERLQKEFGGGGRGYVHVEQRAEYGGRKKGRDGEWTRTRMVDDGQTGKPFGFAGMAIESGKRGDSIRFTMDDEDYVEIFYHAHKSGPRAYVKVDGTRIGTLKTKRKRAKTKKRRFKLPRRKKRDKERGRDKRLLEIEARGGGLTLFGVSFTLKKKGIVYDSVGPVGADANTYTDMDATSFKDSIKLLSPDLVIIMLGGNDALRLRKKRATEDEIRERFERLIKRVRDAKPDADCMLWAPMDAGERQRSKIVQKSHIEEVRAIQHEVAIEHGCAFWDMYAAMGGRGSIQRWYKAGIINRDLIHPRHKAGLLLGHLFATALMKKYDEG